MRYEGMQEAIRFLDSWLEYRARRVSTPGFTIAIHTDGQIVFSRAYGVADLERNEAMSVDHLFSVASQSKMFTATAVLQLAEQGKLQLSDKACIHLPWLAAHRDQRVREITVRQLLCHGAGLLRDGLEADFWNFGRPFPDHAGLQSAVLAAGLAFRPNSYLKYSNLGYALLGAIIETVSGTTYADFVVRHIITPLQLRNTFVDYSSTLTSRLAIAYSVPHEHQRQALESRLPTKAFMPAVGIHATVYDMCRFASALFPGSGSLLSDQTKRRAQRRQWTAKGYDEGTGFGLGFEISRIGRRRTVGHTGHLAGHLTATFFDPRARTAVAVMGNCQDAPSEQIVRGIFETIDHFTTYATAPVPKKLAHFNARMHNAMATVEIVATDKLIAAIDPDDWEPFAWREKLEYVDTKTLRFTTKGSVYNGGETIRYTFASGVAQAIQCAGFTLTHLHFTQLLRQSLLVLQLARHV